MPQYTIPYEWTVTGCVTVDAADLQTAVDILDLKPLDELPHEYANGTFIMRRDVVAQYNPHVTEGDLDEVVGLDE